MSATLKQIGDRVGVTSVTVSRALRGIGRMRPETRAAIRKVALELGHHRTTGVLAASMVRRSNPDWRPCILHPLFKHSWAHPVSPRSPVVEALVKRLAQFDGRLTTEPVKSLKQVEEAWRRDRYHGILVTQPLPYRWISRLKNLGPIVLAGPHNHYHQCGVDLVYADETRAAAMVLDHLVSRGHDTVACLGILDQGTTATEMLKSIDPAFTSDRHATTSQSLRYGAWANLAYCQSGGPQVSLLLVPREWSRQSLDAVVDEGLSRVLSLAPRPTALVALSESIALKTVELAGMRQVRIPEDLSLIAYADNKPHSIPPLTSVIVRQDICGRAVTDLLERRRAMPDAPPISMLIESRLRRGYSVANVRQRT